jgi:hypothetical protein
MRDDKQKQLPGMTQREIHLSQIRNYYWHLRNIRPGQTAKRRQLYRLIQKQKAVLIADGLDVELLRLWCRQFSTCYQEASRARFEAFLQKTNTELKNTR